MNCSNGSSDSTAIQAAINAGGTVTINGTCAMGSTTISIDNPISITGSATLNSNQSQVFQINSNSVAINGLTMNGGFVAFGGALAYSNFTFTNNVIQNLWSGGPNGGPVGLNGPGLISSNISNNHFFNLWGGGSPGYANPTPLANTNPCPGVDCWGSAGMSFSGLDQTIISYNTFDEIASDGMHIDWEAFTGNSYGRTTSGNIISYNTFTHIRRIPIEIQSQPAGHCPGGCNYSAVNTVGLQVKGNYIHDYTQYSYFDTWGASLVADGAVNSQYINNTFVANPGSGYAYGYGGYAPCMESSGRNSLSQGNVCVSIAGGNSSFGAGIAQGNGSNLSFTSTYQNNIFCGSSSTTALIQEAQTNPPTNSKMVDQYNYKNPSSCPSGSSPTASSITAAFVGNASVSGTNETWNLSVISNLSVRYVQFFLDSSTTPATTQEISDVSTTFATDHKWLYHLTLSAASLGTGNHTVTALVTDASGATKSVSQGVGTSAPAVKLSTSNVSFGSQAIGLAATAQAVTLTNVGSADLSISGISLSSAANSGDFPPTTNCTGALTAGASCTINVTFTPSVAGVENATILVADNASDSPQPISLTGSGVAPATVAAVVNPVPNASPSSPSTLPATLPQGMILWLANDAGVVNIGGGVSAWKDQSGQGNDAVQTATANQPAFMPANNSQNAIHFDGCTSFMSIPSVPISGLTGMTVLVVSSNDQDEPNAGYGNYSVLTWPETAAWGTTFFGTYQTSSHFRFGTTQAGNEDYSPLSLGSNGFGLGEWMHDSTTDSMWLNGQSVISLPGRLDTLSGTGGNVVVGLGYPGTFYHGNLYEVIVYNRALSQSERNAVEQYLMTKYNL